VLAVRSAAAQPALADFPDEGRPAPTPPKNPSTGIAVSFADSAAGLPQEEIRAAIARELERRPAGEASVQGELNVAVDGNQMVVRFRSTQAYTERVLPLPADRTQIPLMLSLLAGNLGRDQRVGMHAEAEPAAPRDVAPDKKAKQQNAPPFARHHFGLHLAQDIAFVGGFNACDPTLGQADQNLACYYAGTEEPFFHKPNPSTDTVTNHPAFATTRILLSYDFALLSRFTLGARIGFAFRGGPPAGMAPANGELDPPAHTPGTGGTAFFPGHLELRATYWFAPLSEPGWHGFFGLGGGMAQVDTKASVHVEDCNEVARLNAGGTNSPVYQNCRQGGAPTTDLVHLDAWQKSGQAFLSVHGGVTVPISSGVSAELNVNLMYMLPATAAVIEPSLGVVTGL